MTATLTVHQEAAAVLDRLGVPRAAWAEGDMASFSPLTGEEIARVRTTSPEEAAAAVDAAHEAFKAWRLTPAPRRGELVRLLGEELRAAKADLGRLVTIEAGKIASEGLGEVQEMIDICDFAVGLSRQLYGLTIATERPGHRMMETWHPLGVVGVISAFNFPVAVWSWNAALALVCGDAVVWKPSEKTPLTALACQAVLERALARFGDAPAGLSQVLIGDRTIGEALVDHPKAALVSATGSTRMGRQIAPRLAARFARSILELGGNNGGVVCPSADLDMALRAIAFGAMGTAGQRCTTLRRLFVHDSVYDQLVPRLKAAYASVSVGDPLKTSALVGPLIDRAAFDAMQQALEAARAEGGAVTGGGARHGLLCQARPDRDAGPDRPGAGGDLRPHPLCDEVFGLRRRAGTAQRRGGGPVLVHLHPERPGGGAFHGGRRLGLRHRQRQHRHLRGRDRRRLRRREGDGRRARERLGLLAGLYAARHQYGELFQGPAPGPGRLLRHRLGCGHGFLSRGRRRLPPRRAPGADRRL